MITNFICINPGCDIKSVTIEAELDLHIQQARCLSCDELLEIVGESWWDKDGKLVSWGKR